MVERERERGRKRKRERETCFYLFEREMGERKSKLVGKCVCDREKVSLPFLCVCT